LRGEEGYANVLGMNVFYQRRVRFVRPAKPTEVVTILESKGVTEVRRSTSGFKTSTGTIRHCALCRDEDLQIGPRGVFSDPAPIGTWLLISRDLDMNQYDEMVVCSPHFKVIRDRGPERQPGLVWTLNNIQFNEQMDSKGEPWGPTLPQGRA